jgi:CheY-like chemotaxis protein
MMGGEVGFASRLGHGSCFWFDLPLVEAPAPAPAETVARASRLLTATGERPCVLVVDDNATNRLVARSLLDRLGCRTELAGDGAEAIEAAGRERFDLILMDISMPVMDGIEATRRLRAQGLATPIVALTASAGFGDAEKFLAAGMNDCLLKPVSAEALANTLARAFGSRGDAGSEGRSPPVRAASPVLDQGYLGGLPAEIGEETLAIRLQTAEGDLTLHAGRCRDALASANRAELRAAAHALKVIAASVGATALRGRAAALELTAREPTAELPASLDLSDLLEATLRTMAAASPALAQA